MYRPKEPETRQPDAGQASPGRSPASLLDLIGHPRTEQGAETYRRLAVPETRGNTPEVDNATEEQAPDSRRASIQNRLNAQLRSLRELGPADILLWLQQRLLLVIAATILGVCAAVAYGLTATPRYTVYTDLIIDPQNLNVVSDDVFASNPQREAQLLEVESRLRVLTSRNVLRQVISDLDLTEDPEFVKPGLLEPLFRIFSPATSLQDRELGVLRQLSERVDARREERSFVVVLSVWSEEPDKAVRLSESIVRAFEAELFESAATSAGRIAAGLNERLDELRAAVTAAEEKVEAFRRGKRPAGDGG
jgi:succinoglycan biosynthesis transport protein ExoP